MSKKIVVVNAGPRHGWNTDTLLSEAAKGAEQEGAEIIRFDLFRLEKYTGCISCFGCKKEKFKGHCICRDGLTPVLGAAMASEEWEMQFMIKALDGEGKLEKRMEVRPRHLEGMKKLGKQIVCAGGLLDEEGKMKGSVLILDFPDRKALDEYLANEPYMRENVWEKVEVEAMNVVLVNGEKG